jgi:hypothetical protein
LQVLGSSENRLSPGIAYFSSNEIEKLLVGSPLYYFTLNYPREITSETIMGLCKQGGALISTDIVSYIDKKPVDLVDKARRAERRLASLLNGSKLTTIGRVKLVDIVLLDSALLAKGDIVAMAWGVAEFQDEIDYHVEDNADTDLDRWHATREISAQGVHILRLSPPIKGKWTVQEKTLALALVTTSRWFQLVDRGDLTWLYRLRREVGTDKSELDTKDTGKADGERY